MMSSQNTLARHVRTGISMGCGAAFLLLSGCSEPERILPGLREDVRSVLQTAEQGPELAAETEGNISRPLALAAPTANPSWTHGIGTPAYRVAHPALGTSPQRAWSAKIGAGDSRKYRITADPVVADGRIFTLDSQARVSATGTNGAALWSVDLTPDRDKPTDATGGGLAVEGDTLYVSLGHGVLAAVDTSTGAKRWTQQLDATASGRPTVWGDLVYVTSGDDTGWAVRKTDGRVQWQIGTSPDVNNVLGAPAPAVTDDLAIFGFGSGEIQAVFRRGGLSRWDASVLGQRPGRALGQVSDITGEPVISGEVVYVGNQAGRIAALSLGSGARIWTAREGAIDAVWPAGDSVFALTDINELVRLDATDGTRIWGVPLPNFVKKRPKRQSEVFAHHGPIIAGGRVIVASNDGVLRSFDPTDGTLLGTTEIPGGASTAPVVAGGTLYVVSANGQLHAFR